MSESDRVDLRHIKSGNKSGRRRFSRHMKLVGALVGAMHVAGTAYAATDWVVGLGTGSAGEAQSGSVSNLTINAVASPAASNVLYPGGTGDVVVTIANPNPYPVTITAVDLPANLLRHRVHHERPQHHPDRLHRQHAERRGWNYSTGTSGTSHTLTTPLVVAASGQSNNPLVVTFTNDASMTAAAPAACESTYFSMSSLTGVAATGGTATATTSPATDSWTS